jgi:hypothetical protein
MLDNIDIKIFGVVGILILLVLGYFVYVLYQDIVFLKKEVLEIKKDKKQESWSDEEDLKEQESFSDYGEEDDEEQESELERHLASFMQSQEPIESPISPQITEVEPENICTLEERQEEPNQEENKPKRVYKKKVKILEPIQEIED